MDKKIALLSDIGFSPLEAEAYMALADNPHATGYRIARLLNKPVPNTYKALDSLRQKGAVVIDESGRKRCFVALPIKQYLDNLERQFGLKRRRIEELLSKSEMPSQLEGIFRLETAEQVYEIAETIIGEAQTVVAADILPGPLERIRKSLVGAGKRIDVLVRAYAEVKLPGCEVVSSTGYNPLNYGWPTEWIHVVADAKRYVAALFDTKKDYGVVRAVWCESPFLAMIAYNGLFAEFVEGRLWTALKEESPKKASTIIEKYDSLRPSRLQHVMRMFADEGQT